MKKQAKSNNLPYKMKLTMGGRLDQWLCRPTIGIPLFLVLMFFVFYLTFSGIGDWLSTLLERFFAWVLEAMYTSLVKRGASEMLCRFLILGVFRGVASVLAFLPQTAILFFWIAFLDGSGYMARAVLVMDYALRPFGLSGRAFIPFLIGFGCNVPAVISAAELEQKEKKVVTQALPFIPCNARLPVFTMIVSVFFENQRAHIAFFVYMIGIGTAILSSLFFFGRSSPAPLKENFPPLRFPKISLILSEVKINSKEYLIRAGTVVFLSCLAVDFLGTFTPQLKFSSTGEDSILAQLGSFLAPLFAPLGFDDGRLIAALAAGFFAKETIVSTIEILLPNGIRSVLNPEQALSFLVFSFLYTPCITTVFTIKKVLGASTARRTILRSFCIAYALTYLIYTLFPIFAVK